MSQMSRASQEDYLRRTLRGRTLDIAASAESPVAQSVVNGQRGAASSPNAGLRASVGESIPEGPQLPVDAAFNRNRMLLRSPTGASLPSNGTKPASPGNAQAVPLSRQRTGAIAGMATQQDLARRRAAATDPRSLIAGQGDPRRQLSDFTVQSVPDPVEIERRVMPLRTSAIELSNQRDSLRLQINRLRRDQQRVGTSPVRRQELQNAIERLYDQEGQLSNDLTTLDKFLTAQQRSDSPLTIEDRMEFQRAAQGAIEASYNSLRRRALDLRASGNEEAAIRAETEAERMLTVADEFRANPSLFEGSAGPVDDSLAARAAGVSQGALDRVRASEELRRMLRQDVGIDPSNLQLAAERGAMSDIEARIASNQAQTRALTATEEPRTAAEKIQQIADELQLNNAEQQLAMSRASTTPEIELQRIESAVGAVRRLGGELRLNTQEDLDDLNALSSLKQSLDSDMANDPEMYKIRVGLLRTALTGKADVSALGPSFTTRGNIRGAIGEFGDFFSGSFLTSSSEASEAHRRLADVKRGLLGHISGQAAQ